MITFETHLWIHNTFPFKTAEENVHGVDFTPQIAIVLTIIPSSQVTETGRHVGTYRQQIFVVVVSLNMCQVADIHLLLLKPTTDLVQQEHPGCPGSASQTPQLYLHEDWCAATGPPYLGLPDAGS